MIYQKKSRLLWADVIRVLAIVMVVLIHTTAPIILRFNEYSPLEWNYANMLNSASRMSIALFVMISGSFLLEKKESLNQFLSKRLKRILVPWLVWGTIQLLYNYNFSLTEIFAGNFQSKLLATYFGGFWFMPLILGLYLITPFIKPFAQSASKKEWKYFFILWFLFVPTLTTLNLELEKNISLQLPIWIKYLGYYLFGFYAVHKLRLPKKLNSQMGILSALFVTLIALHTWFQANLRGEFFSATYEYTNLLVSLSSFATFIWLKSYLQTKYVSKALNRHRKLIESFSMYSFGIFLSHSLILQILTHGVWGVQFSALTLSPLFSIPIMFALVFFSSYGIVRVANNLVPNTFT